MKSELTESQIDLMYKNQDNEKAYMAIYEAIRAIEIDNGGIYLVDEGVDHENVSESRTVSDFDYWECMIDSVKNAFQCRCEDLDREDLLSNMKHLPKAK